MPLQVSGLSFAFDPDKPAGSRIVPGSVRVGAEPLQLDRLYKVSSQEGTWHALLPGNGVAPPRAMSFAAAACLAARYVPVPRSRGSQHTDQQPCSRDTALPPATRPSLTFDCPQVATKAYLRGGKDGFESLKAARVLVDGETNPRLATLVQVGTRQDIASQPYLVPV